MTKLGPQFLVCAFLAHSSTTLLSRQVVIDCLDAQASELFAKGMLWRLCALWRFRGICATCGNDAGGSDVWVGKRRVQIGEAALRGEPGGRRSGWSVETIQLRPSLCLVEHLLSCHRCGLTHVLWMCGHMCAVLMAVHEYACIHEL